MTLLSGTSRQSESLGRLLRLGDVTRILGITPRAVRYYESSGLLSPRRVGYVRVYGNAEIKRLKLIVLCRNADLSIAQIREILAAEGDDGTHRQRTILVSFLRAKLSHVRVLLDELGVRE